MSGIDVDLDRAARAVRDAGALLVTAGAGMGVDSGLPDFRGDEGFWKAYPPFRKVGLRFVELASPRWFHADPALAWGFYGHRTELYRATRPHEGFSILKRWAERAKDAFVFTSNVDGHFQRAGFDEARVVECHGSLAALQCTRACGQPLFSAEATRVTVDPETFRAAPPFPACPGCGALARPNVLMFGDGEWDPSRTEAQEHRLEAWIADVHAASRALVVVELGAGLGIPTVRRFGERVAAALKGTLVRINVRESEVPPGGVALPLRALEALQAIDARL